MSSYLNIYLKDKDTKKDRLLISYSRNTDLYQALWENLHIVHADEDNQLTELKDEDFDKVIDKLMDYKQKTLVRLHENEKYAKDNPDLIEEILSSKEFIEELCSTIAEVRMLARIQSSCVIGCSSFDSMSANIE